MNVVANEFRNEENNGNGRKKGRHEIFTQHLRLQGNEQTFFIKFFFN